MRLSGRVCPVTSVKSSMLYLRFERSTGVIGGEREEEEDEEEEEEK